jgi:hypothetical protein
MICNRTNPVSLIIVIKQTLFVNSTKIVCIEIRPEKPGSGFGNPLGV